jgi:hypothetical protein
LTNNHFNAERPLRFQRSGHLIQKTGAKKIGKKGGSLRPALRTSGPAEATPFRSESNEEPAHHALGRPDDEQLVVDGRGIVRIPEQVPKADEDFPSRAAELEWQGLVDLDVETAVEPRELRGSDRVPVLICRTRIRGSLFRESRRTDVDVVNPRSADGGRGPAASGVSPRSPSRRVML